MRYVTYDTAALPRRVPKEIEWSDWTAPRRCATMYVTTQEMAESAKKGSFSRTRRNTSAVLTPVKLIRFSGQRSKRSKAKGRVTTMGFERRPKVSESVTSRYLRR